MTDTIRFTILGSGASPGVPRIGGDWGACDPAEPKNRRRRCSLLVQRTSAAGLTQVLVDTSPDLREQSIAAGFSALDGVLFTHPHADHLHGIDDLRQFVLNMRKRIDIYADAPTLERLREGFGYCFRTPPGSDYPPIVDAHEIEAGTKVVVSGAGGEIAAMPFHVVHGRIKAVAYRFGGLAYSPDVSDLEPAAEAQLRGLDVWIVDALRYKPHPSHLSVDEALNWIERLKPRRAILTHMHTDLDYQTLRRDLPANVEPGYDGMSLDLPA